MPEGPEIRRAADRVQRAVIGKPLNKVLFGLARLKEFEGALTGAVVTGIETRGKAMLTRFDNGLTVYSHNQLYGRWYVQRAGTTPRTGRQLRFGMFNDKHSALLYSASDIAVVPDDEVEHISFLTRIGPDCLAKGLRASTLARRVRSKPFGGRQLAHLLLDQAFVAGIGNYLRSEILFEAGIHPARRGRDLDDVQANRLGRAIIDMSKRSYKTGGITNDPEIVADLKAVGVRRKSDYRHFVFRRGGDHCYLCGSVVVADVMAGRHIDHCPVCQPL